MRRFCAFALLPLLICVQSCGGSDPSGPDDEDPDDQTPPAAVTDLRVQSISENSVVVTWTSPGDDGADGTATGYDIRYAALPITEGSWPVCNRVTSPPEPVVAGSVQGVQIYSPPQPDVHIALKTVDEAGNWSDMSNVAHGHYEPGTIQVHQLSVVSPTKHPCVSDGVVCWVGWHDGADEIFVANVLGASPTPTRLTSNGGEKWHPSSHGSELILWQGREDGIDDWEIYRYHKYSTPRYSAFTDNDLDDTHPAYAGAGDFAWLQGYILYEELHYWNESGHSESVISDGCCPTESWYSEAPAAHDGLVAWRSYDRAGSGGYHAYLWDGTLTELNPILGAPLSVHFDLHSGGIAYEVGTRPIVITYWDGAGTPRPVHEGYSPSLYAGTIAFQEWDGMDWEIYYWDGSQVIQITDNDDDDTQPSLDAGVIAWVGRTVDGGFSKDHIYYARVEE